MVGERTAILFLCQRVVDSLFMVITGTVNSLFFCATVRYTSEMNFCTKLTAFVAACWMVMLMVFSPDVYDTRRSVWPQARFLGSDGVDSVGVDGPTCIGSVGRDGSDGISSSA